MCALTFSSAFRCPRANGIIQTARRRSERAALRISCALIDELTCLFICKFGSVSCLIFRFRSLFPYARRDSGSLEKDEPHHNDCRKFDEDQEDVSSREAGRIAAAARLRARVRLRWRQVWAASSKAIRAASHEMHFMPNPNFYLRPGRWLPFRVWRTPAYGVADKIRRSRFATAPPQELQGTLPIARIIRQSRG